MAQNRICPLARALRLAALTLLATLLTAPAAVSQARHIFDEGADAHAQVRAALAQAAREHKRVILDFGGNWCGDCQVLDIYLHREPNAALLAANFVLVDIDIGRLDKNVDVAESTTFPSRKACPRSPSSTPTATCSTARPTENSNPCAAWTPIP